MTLMQIQTHINTYKDQKNAKPILLRIQLRIVNERLQCLLIDIGFG